MDRYSRQLLYKNIGKAGQEKLSKSRACIVGIGALGTIASELLARAGVGKLTLIDRDFIELSNLQRQVLFDETDIGKPKAEMAKEKLLKINTEIDIEAKCNDLDYKNITSLIGQTNIILGCTDNLESRFLINDYALKNKLPWTYGGAVSDKGIVFNITPKNACLRCFLKEQSLETCDTAGILNSNSAIVGSIMANEAIKIILGKEHETSLLHIDLWKNEFAKIKVNKNKKCPASSGRYEYLNGEKTTEAVKMCGKGAYQIQGKKYNLNELKKKLEKAGDVKAFAGLLHFGKITVFADGRVIIKADSEKEARSLYSKSIGN